MQYFQSLIDRGLRARLEVQSLVTGQLIVQLGFYPDTPIRLVGGDPDVPEMPTIPTSLQQAQAAAQTILEKIQELPLDQLFANFMQTIEGTNHLVNAPEVPALVRAMSETMTDVQRLVGQVDGQMGRLLDDVGGASAASRAFMTDLQQFVRRIDGQIIPVADSAKQALDAARAIRLLADYLERNPNALLTGKGGDRR